MGRLAPAKVNVLLRIFDRDSRGYHDLETIFLRISLSDEIDLELADRTRLEVSGEFDVPADHTNLCLRARTLFAERVQEAGAQSHHIRLTKRIPVGAGLGGGSADAAAVLLELNERFGRPLSATELASLGGELGSDIPFALSGLAMALGLERGRDLRPLAAPEPRPILILVPSFGIGTAQAYGWLDADRAEVPLRSREPLPPLDTLTDWGVLGEIAANDFEASVFRRYPSLAAGKRVLEQTGAAPALLCGSGSCLFGVFESAADRDSAADEFAGTSGEPDGFRTLSSDTLGPVSAS